MFQVVGGADVHLAYHLRLEGDWLRPPADPASWTGWWESIVASADLPGDVDEVTVRELAPIMTVVAAETGPPDVVAVLLMAARGTAADELEDGVGAPTTLVVAPVVAVTKAKSFDFGGDITTQELLPDRLVSSASGDLSERVCEVYLGGEFASVLWEYRPVDPRANGMTVNFLSNAVEFMDDVGVEVLETAGSFVLVPGEEE